MIAGAVASAACALFLSVAAADAGTTTTTAPRPRTATPAPIAPADVATLRAAIRRPGARAVLVAVWATWCDTCLGELPEVVRFYREHRARGVRLVLVSADEPGDRAQAQEVLTGLGVDFPTFIRTEDDATFVGGIEPKWSGALPASFLYDGRGGLRRQWSRRVSYQELIEGLGPLLRATPAAKR